MRLHQACHITAYRSRYHVATAKKTHRFTNLAGVDIDRSRQLPTIAILVPNTIGPDPLERSLTHLNAPRCRNGQRPSITSRSYSKGEYERTWTNPYGKPWQKNICRPTLLLSDSTTLRVDSLRSLPVLVESWLAPRSRLRRPIQDSIVFVRHLLKATMRLAPGIQRIATDEACFSAVIECN